MVRWAAIPQWFHSRPLSRLLQSIMANKVLFQQQSTPNTNGIIEVRTPTEEDTVSATLRVNEMFPSHS